MKKILSTTAILLAVAGWTSFDRVSAQSPVSVDVAPFVVSGAETFEVDSHLSGSLIVFGDRSTAGAFIRYRDLSVPGSETLTVPGDLIHFLPDVSGTRVVFNARGSNDDGTPVSVIRLFDTANPGLAPIEVSPSPGVYRQYPAIGGDTIAFVQYVGSGPEKDLCVSSVSDPLRPATCLTAGGTVRFNETPEVSPDGGVVVWQGCYTNSVNCDIFVARRDAESAWSAPQVLADAGTFDSRPDTDGRFVTWSATTWNAETMSMDNGVYAAELTGGSAPRRIAVIGGAAASTVHIAGGVVVFEVTSNDPYDLDVDIHLVDLTTGARAVLRDTPAMEFLPDVSQDADGKFWVTWTQHVSEMNVDVWAMRLDLRSPIYTVQPLFDQSRSHKAGSVVPIRLRLLDAAGVNVSSASMALTATALVQKDGTAEPLVVEDAGNANPDGAFRYDAALQGYVFNLATKGLTAGTWELRFTLAGDGREYAVTFDVR